MNHSISTPSSFPKASILFKAGAVSLTLGIFLGCSKSGPNIVGDYSVGIAPQDATLEAYRDHRIVIDLEPGNHNPKISWATLYDSFPGEAPPPDRKEDEEDLSLKKIAKAVVGGKSTKKNFSAWKDDPVGLRAELDRRFTKQMRSYVKSKTAKADLTAAGKAHDVDPILILACMVGENIFNVNGFDDIGGYVVMLKAMSEKWTERFHNNKIDLVDLLKRPEFEVCEAPKRAGGLYADYWECVDALWSRTFAGKMIDGVRYPNTGFKWAFFDPIGTGFSYGPGQLDPIRALMVTDQVNRKSGLRLLTIERADEIYRDIIDPKTTFHYVAANVRLMIDRYRTVGNFDISKNPGVVASLYNLGRENKKAHELYANNLKSLKSGQIVRPIENYYGFYMNEKEALMRQAFERWAL